MGIGTLFQYLLGSRAAILSLAADSRTWLIGLVFVASAAFAREYDGEDLLHEPWYLAIPFAASLVSSFVLFVLLFVPSRIARVPGPPFFAAYRAFLGLFWLTAPLAWLYAIPYERFLDPLAAMQANILTLAGVSIWRVALMVRVANVLIGLPPLAAFSRVLAYADTVALIAISFLPFPIIEIMGGMRATQVEMAARSAAAWVGCGGGITLPIWCILALSAGNRINWALPQSDDAVSPKKPISLPLCLLAIASLAIWIPILPFTQREQQARFSIEGAYRQDDYDEVIKRMSAIKAEDLPPQWEPPPRLLKGDRPSTVVPLLRAVVSNPECAPWVRRRYLELFQKFVQHSRFHAPEELKAIANLLNQLPEAPEMLRSLRAAPDHGWLVSQLEPFLRPELRERSNDGDNRPD